MKRAAEEDCNSSSSDEEHMKPKTSKCNRLGKCEVCANNDAIYACPKCEVKTCSVQCVNIHKKELSCDGIRDRTKFIPVRNMTQMDFMSDYYFLEECTRYVGNRKYDPIKRFTRAKNLPTRLFKLKNAAQSRNITLHFLIQNFSRHKENTSILDWKTKKILWHVEWIFINANSLKYVDKQCAEDVPLCDLIDKYVNPNCTDVVPRKKDLQFYQSVDVSNLRLLLRAEGIKKSGKRFYCLDVFKSLKDNLANKIIVEYPTIYISYETNTEGFDVIDSDEDVKQETENYQKSLHEFSKNQQEAKEFKPSNSKYTQPKEIKKQEKQTSTKSSSNNKCKDDVAKKTSVNFLFTDEKMLDTLSSSSSSESDVDNDCQEWSFPTL